MIRRLLIANRGEIAVRIISTCREMGIESVAVYSDFDRDAPHVRSADQALRIGPADPGQSYLDIAAIVAAARQSRADAVHPGYGFLAENAEFAQTCVDAGLIFVGPSAAVIRAMGSKAEARRIAIEAGVPVVPEPAPGEFPVLVKASAGGGGRGMRIVRSAADLPAALESARGEAERAFGDGTLLLEKYIEGARHIEIQIFGDHHGRIVHLYERDCSIQRRYQKVIEESPSPAVSPELRERMCDAALVLARHIRYTNAGTVEFLLAPSGEFYFIEVNTRIQVEHPVTEMVTGLDLIRLQIDIAEGRPLPVHMPQRFGHAIEARLYAEDPANDFLPSTGTLHVWQRPEYVRVDTGVEQGSEIGIHYDPLLAKVIAYARDRDSAVRKLVYALTTFAVQGVTTNREHLIHLLGGEIPETDDALLASVVCAHIERTARDQRGILPAVPLGFRNNAYPRPPMRFEIAGREYAVQPAESTAGFEICQHGDVYFIRSRTVQRTVRRLPRYPRPKSAHKHETAGSPMPGRVLRILVAIGQRVNPGDALVVLEAMKMEQTINTAIRGVVAAIPVQTGDVVAPGQKLIEIESIEEDGNEHASGTAASDD